MFLLMLSAALVLATAANPDLARGEELFTQYKYADAIKALTKARTAKGLDRASLLKILELTGVSAGQLRQTAQAQAAFRELLVLDPAHQLQTEYAPRVMTPFYEVRQQVIERGSLEVKPIATTTTRVESVGVSLVRDPLSMARGVRFHLLTDGAWKTTDAMLTAGTATLPVSAPEVTWWAELLGENEAVLAMVGSEAAPRVDGRPTPVAAAEPAAKVEKVPTRSSSPLRGVSYAVVGVGVVAAGVGAYFGVQSSAAFAQVRRAPTDSVGRITGLTERRAYQLDAQGKQQAMIANVLFVSAGVLAAGGVAMWIAGAPVVVTPAPNGVVIAGALP